MFGFYRLAAVVPQLKLGDVKFNVREIISQYEKVSASGGALALFPELSITGSSCGDLFGNQQLLSDALCALEELRLSSKGTIMICGIPVAAGSMLFNMVAILQNQQILGFVPKSIPSRNFAPGSYAPAEIMVGDKSIPCGTNLLFSASNDFVFGIEIGNNHLLPLSPAANLAVAGAQIICNPTAEMELADSGNQRLDFVKTTSRKLSATYICAGAGVHESTSDGVYAGHALMGSNGKIIAQTTRFQRQSQIIYSDIKPLWSNVLRRKRPFYGDYSVRKIAVAQLPQSPSLEFLHLNSRPFIPEDPQQCALRCNELFDIQSAALAKRVEHTHAQRLVLGISGGLDSTLALLVCAKCCDLLNLDRSKILAVTMPGFGTSSRTKNNAEQLALELGAKLLTIPIAPSVRAHFQDIGHDEKIQDVVYENAQARERTQILMDLANQENGLCVGTGDLSELALGWCTFNGDQMAMYGVNAALPKTLIRFMVAHYAKESSENLRNRLLDINATPVSPELVPGKQETEKLLGDYDIHDFYIYYFIKYGETPETLLALAKHAFGNEYSLQELQNALKVFLRRFFSSQFKRNSLPDGPKLGTISLSPRGDWIMPSDNASLWN